MIELLRNNRVYLDANVLIYAVEGYEKYAKVASFILDAIDAGIFSAVSSELTFAEVLVGPYRNGRPDVAVAYEGLLGEELIELVPVTRPLLKLSAELRASDRGKLADAIHCATAIRSGCKYLMTADRSFKVSRGLERILLDDLLPDTIG